MIFISICCCGLTCDACCGLRPWIWRCWYQAVTPMMRDQHQVREGVDDALRQGLASADVGQVEPEGVHLAGDAQVLVELRVVVEVARVEGAEVLERPPFGCRPARPKAAAHVLGVAVRVGEAVEHPVEDDEDRHLQQQRQAAAHRVDVVLLVELHHLLVELLPVVLVLRLQLLHLRLEPLHGHHRPGALERQRGEEDHDRRGSGA